jgi:hypothetical protein
MAVRRHPIEQRPVLHVLFRPMGFGQDDAPIAPGSSNIVNTSVIGNATI